MSQRHSGRETNRVKHVKTAPDPQPGLHQARSSQRYEGSGQGLRVALSVVFVVVLVLDFPVSSFEDENEDEHEGERPQGKPILVTHCQVLDAALGPRTRAGQTTKHNEHANNEAMAEGIRRLEDIAAGQVQGLTEEQYRAAIG